MANKVETGKYLNHDIRSNNGSYIIMPPWFQGESGWGNLKLPNVYNTNDVAALYPVGTKYVEGERIFYYGKHLGRAATHGATPGATGADELGRIHFTNAYQRDMASGLVTRAVAGEDSMWYTTTPSAPTGLKADNYLSGGWVNGKDTGSATRPFYRRIVAHNYTAAAGSATEPTRPESLGTTWDNSGNTLNSELILDQPIVTSVTALTSMLLPNPWKHCYREVASASDIYYGAMGACCYNNPDADYYVWYQTWGPCSTIWITDFGGQSNRESLYWVMGDGSIISNAHDGSTYFQNNPIAGQVMFSTYVEGTTGADEQTAVMYYLQLRR